MEYYYPFGETVKPLVQDAKVPGTSAPPAQICGKGRSDRSNEGKSSPISQRSGNAV